MLNYNHLQYFWAVAREANLTRAARQLHVSPSSVSAQIRKLEDALGHALFERRGRNLELTEAGRITFDHAETIFGLGEELESTLRDEGRPRRVLRVGAQATLSRNFQLGFLAPLVGREDVDLIVRSGSLTDLLGHLETHAVDVVLATTAPPHDAATPWVVHAAGAQPVSLVGPARKPRRVPPLAELLTAHPLVVPTASSGIRAGFDALVARLGVRPRLAAEIDDMAMLRLFARAGVGLAVVPPIVVQDELAGRELAEWSRLPIEETFLAITSRRRFPNPLLRQLLPRGQGV